MRRRSDGKSSFERVGEGVIAHIDAQARNECWNLYDSYGEICVHCGCCSKNKLIRYKARIEAIKGWIWQHENWYKPDKTWEEYQHKNHRKTMRHWRRQLRYYEKKLEGMEARA